MPGFEPRPAWHQNQGARLPRRSCPALRAVSQTVHVPSGGKQRVEGAWEKTGEVQASWRGP